MLLVKPHLKKIREEKGFVQEKLASMIYVHQTTYSKIETGEISLKPEIAVRISMILEVPVKDFAEISGTLYYIITNSFTESEAQEDVKGYIKENIIEETIINIIGNLDTIYNEFISNKTKTDKLGMIYAITNLVIFFN